MADSVLSLKKIHGVLGNISNPYLDWPSIMGLPPSSIPPTTLPPYAPQTSTAVKDTPSTMKTDNANYRREVLRYRLQWPTHNGPFLYLDTLHLKGADKVAVVIQKDDEVVVLKDDAPMYPSDTLITQIRLLEP